MITVPQERTLIGLHVRIVGSAQRDDAGFGGTIVDETRDTIIVDEAMRKRIRKKEVVLEVDIRGRKITLSGADLVGLPEERIKKIR